MRAERGCGTACGLAGRLAWMALASWLALAGCGGDDGSGDGSEHELPWLARRASDVRELDFFRDVEIVRLTRAEFQAQAAENADELDDAELREFSDTFGRLGFFPLDADLRPILAGSSDWVGASYSATSKLITLVEDEPGDAADSIQVHEYVHALQDQYFDLNAFDGSTSDEFLARRAVVEGDATLAEARFVAQTEFGGELDDWDWPALLGSFQERSTELLEGAAFPLFADYPSFVYRYGLEYTAKNLLSPHLYALPPHNWSLEDELFTERPPTTTRQVISVEFEVRQVELVGVDAVPVELEGRLEAAGWDTLGAWYAYLLFYELSPFRGPTVLADLWRGDRVLFVRDPARSGAVATVWGSAWAGEGTAIKVAAALDALYGRTPSENRPQSGTAADGEAVWLERRDNRVVVIKNLDPELAEPMADAAFAPPATARAARSRPPLGWRIRDLIE